MFLEENQKYGKSFYISNNKSEDQIDLLFKKKKKKKEYIQQVSPPLFWGVCNRKNLTFYIVGYLF